MPWGRVRCSFCGKNREAVGKLVSGRHGYICEACVTAASRIIDASNSSASPVEMTEQRSVLRRLLTTLRRAFNAAQGRPITIEGAA
jgi:ATP-dependent protease Clp ATPase subunit